MGRAAALHAARLGGRADHCCPVQQQITHRQAQVVDLEARLNQHSQNAAKPRSSDPPAAPPRPTRTPRGRSHGGQPGHPRYARPDPDLWEDSRLSIRKIALQLGMLHRAVKYHAARLGLSLHRPQGKGKGRTKPIKADVVYPYSL